MRAFVWTLALLTVTAVLVSAVTAETYTSPAGVVRAGTNYFSLPAEPATDVPPVIFAGVPIDNKLAYWCRYTQQWYTYPDLSHFEDMLWHMGYRLVADGDYTITFEGSQPTAEMSTCINPNQAGLVFISQPYDHESRWADFKFISPYDPMNSVTIAQAAANGWIEPYLIEGSPTSGVRITLDGAGGTSTTVKPWCGYWLTVKVPPSVIFLRIYWPQTAAPVTIADVKERADGSIAALHNKVVTAIFAGCFYIEESDRSAAIRVDAPGAGVTEGAQVNIIGTIRTDGAERYIAASTVR